MMADQRCCKGCYSSIAQDCWSVRYISMYSVKNGTDYAFVCARDSHDMKCQTTSWATLPIALQESCFWFRCNVIKPSFKTGFTCVPA